MGPTRTRVWLAAASFLIVGMAAATLGGAAQAAQAGAALAVDTATFSPTFTSTLYTPTPFAPQTVVISEFRTRGPNGDGDEFVELYNPTGAAVTISSWAIKRSADCGTTVATVVTVIGGTLLQAGQHYLLLSSSGSSLSGADQTFSPSLTDTGGLALVDSSGNVVDAVGMCNTTLYREGTNLVPLSGNVDQSYERKPGGATACYDTNSNAGDFNLISPSNPQNKNAPIALCSGVALYTPTSTGTRTPTRTPTPTATTIPGFVVINEFLPHPHSDWNQDGQINVNDEFIELMNLSQSPVSIRNWKLDNGPSTTAFALPDITLQSRQIVVYFRFETGIPLSDGGGTVRLVKSDGRTADNFNYPPVEAMDRTWCRLYNKSGLLTFTCNPTPGRPNVEANPTPAATPTGSIPSVNPDCSLPDTIPPAMVLGECKDMGEGIWQASPVIPVYLTIQSKWLTFIE